MRAKSVVLLVLALGCGLVASIGITQVMAKRDVAPAGPGEEMDAIFVALEDIPMGEAVNAEVLKLEPWPKTKIPPGSLSRIEDVEGRRAKTKIYQGSPIIDDQLLAKGSLDGGAPVLIPKGYRVVSVKVDAVIGSASLIRPGDRVDVLVHLQRNPTKAINETSTRVILQDIRVFAVDDKFVLEPEEKDKKSLVAKTVSLLVTPEQAQKVMLATELGTIRLAMRGLGDNEAAQVKPLTPQDLLEGSDKGDPERELVEPPVELVDNSLGTFRELIRETPEPPKPEPKPIANFTMRIIAGSQVNDVVLESEGEQPEGGAPGTGFTRWRTVSPGSFPPTPPPAAVVPGLPPGLPEELAPDEFAPGEPEPPLQDSQENNL